MENKKKSYIAKFWFYVGEFTRVIAADTLIHLVSKPKKKGGENV